MRQVPFPERNLQAEVILERQQSLGHPVNRRGAPRPHLMHPPPPKERVHARDLVATSGQVLGERPAQVTIESGDEYPHTGTLRRGYCLCQRQFERLKFQCNPS